MSSKLSELQEALAGLPRSKSGRIIGVSAAQRHEIIELSKSRDRRELALTLGLGTSTLENWRREAQVPKQKKKVKKATLQKSAKPTFKVLAVEQEAPVPVTFPKLLEVVGPHAMRVSGLSLGDVAKLFLLMGSAHA